MSNNHNDLLHHWISCYTYYMEIHIRNPVIHFMKPYIQNHVMGYLTLSCTWGNLVTYATKMHTVNLVYTLITLGHQLPHVNQLV